MSKVLNFIEFSNSIMRMFSNKALTSKAIDDLHAQLENNFISAVNAAILDGHPGWCVCSGQRATELYLCRNWLRGTSLDDEVSRLAKVAAQMENDLVQSHGMELSTEQVEYILRQLDQQDQFSSKVMKNEPLLILQTGCSHRQFSALCRPYFYQDDSFGCDIYLFHRKHDETVSLESILLHELGHVLNLRLTEDVTVVPKDFLEFGEYFFPGLSTTYLNSAPEFFAHCFAMGITSRPEFQQYDSFPKIQLEHKQLFDAYMKSKLAAL